MTQFFSDGYDSQPEAFWSDVQPTVVQPQGESTSFWGGAEQDSWGWAYPVQQHGAVLTDESSSGTSSDSGNEYVETSAFSRMSDAEAQEQAYWQHRMAKRRWRRFTGRPARSVRRVIRRRNMKGKGKGGRMFYTQDDVSAYLKGRGKMR